MAVTYYLCALLLAVVVGGQAGLGKEPAVVESEMNTEVLRPLLNSMIQNPYLCKACESFVGFLKNVTENKTTLEELVKLLLPLCDWAPYTLHENCIKIIEEIPTEVKMYADMYLDPKVDCAFLCAAQPMINETKPLINNLVKMINNPVRMMMNKKTFN